MKPNNEKGCADVESLSIGYRININDVNESDRLKGQAKHWSGGYLEGTIKEINCPNCFSPLFPVFKLSLHDDNVRELGLWNEEYLQILVCASCSLYLKPYWVR